MTQVIVTVGTDDGYPEGTRLQFDADVREETVVTMTVAGRPGSFYSLPITGYVLRFPTEPPIPGCGLEPPRAPGDQYVSLGEDRWMTQTPERVIGIHIGTVSEETLRFLGVDPEADAMRIEDYARGTLRLSRRRGKRRGGEAG